MPPEKDTGLGQSIILRTDLHFAEAAGEVHPRPVDLAAVGLAFQIDARTDSEVIVQRGCTEEVDFSIVEEAVGVTVIAEFASPSPSITAI